MRAIVHWLQRTSTAGRVRPRCFGVDTIGDGRFIDRVFLRVRGFLRMRWVQTTVVDGGGGHGLEQTLLTGFQDAKTRTRSKRGNGNLHAYIQLHEACATPVKGKEILCTIFVGIIVLATLSTV